MKNSQSFERIFDLIFSSWGGASSHWCFSLMTLQDLRYFKSKKTNRGLLQEGWINSQDPIMCSYKLVTVKFEVWGLQSRVEQFVHKVRH